MSNSTIYNQIIDSKTGIKIPLFTDGKSVESRYDPERDCLRTIQANISEETGFYIVLGIAGGILIDNLIKAQPNVFVLAVEKSQADIEFLLQLDTVKNLSENQNVCLCSVDQVQEKIKELYVPAFYGNLKVIEQRGWVLENSNLLEKVQSSIQNAINIVSADFSVQSHFGKLWQHNLMANIKTAGTSITKPKCKIDTSKTAVIIAAGPTLDSSITQIINNRQEYFVIATDTAFSILLSYKIIPDAVVSLDGQNISNVHFIHSYNEFNIADLSETLFLFDICANPSAVKTVSQISNNLLFFYSGHPFASYLNQNCNIKLPMLYSGSGTVTICSVDFAIKAGFNNLIVLGADFSYTNGKPYAKGTYLDRIYGDKAKKTFSFEKQFSTLLYRTPLFKSSQNRFTTQILDNYRASFEQYLTDINASFTRDNTSYKIKSGAVKQIMENFFPKDLSTQKIAQSIINEKPLDFEKTNPSFFELSLRDISLLPLISWLRYNDNKNKGDFKYYYNLALNYFKKYL